MRPNLILRVVLALVQEKMPRYVHAQISDIQVLTPMRKGALGVENLNQVLQRYPACRKILVKRTTGNALEPMRS